jgi:hypothetical protein
MSSAVGRYGKHACRRRASYSLLATVMSGASSFFMPWTW